MRKNKSNRNKWHYLFFLFLAFVLALVPSKARGDLLSQPNPAIWQITSENSTAYLLGSISIGNDDFYPLCPKIETLFAETTKLVVEVDLTTVNPEEVNLSILEQALYPGEDTIDQHLSGEEFALLEETLARFGIPVNNLIKFRPWFLKIMVETLNYQIVGYFPEQGVDLYFLKKAGDKEIVGLETAAFQATLWAQFSANTEKTAFVDTLTSDLESKARNLVAAWWSGDLKNLEKMIFQDLQKDPIYREIYEKVYFERNRKMAEQISELLATSDTYFILIHAGHLVGDQSIISILQQQGFNVKLL